MAEMLGIMVTRYEQRDHIIGLAKAAQAAGHRVQIFLTDEGVRFTKDGPFLELLKIPGVEIAVCDHICERTGLHDRTPGIVYGSQYNNAAMLHDSARVLIF